MSPYSGNTTNFATHLEHHHPAEYSAFLEESGRRTSASADGSSSSTQATLTRSQPLPKTSSCHKLLGDILETAGHGEVQTEEEMAEAELQRYESQPGETLDCQQPLQWWKVRSVNYKYLSKLAKKHSHECVE